MPTQRTHGWRKTSGLTARGSAFTWGFDLLKKVVSDAAPRSLNTMPILVNRNVLVDGDRISAVFDWAALAMVIISTILPGSKSVGPDGIPS